MAAAKSKKIKGAAKFLEEPVPIRMPGDPPGNAIEQAAAELEAQVDADPDLTDEEKAAIKKDLRG